MTHNNPLWKSLLALIVAALACSVAWAQQPVPLPAGCVAWWKGDGNANDSASTNHGIALNGATYAAGFVGQAFSLDGVDDMISVGRGLALGSLTIETWIQIDPAKNTGNRHLFSRYQTVGTSGTSNLFTLVTSGSSSWEGRLVFIVASYEGGYHEDVLIGPVLPAGWHHVAAARDLASSRIDLYLDGVAVGTKSGLVVTNVIAPDVDGVIGGVNTNYVDSDGREAFSGLVDELAVYSRALYSTEIAAIYQAGSAGKVAPTPVALPSGCVAWWKWDGNASDSASTNLGTLMNDLGFGSGMVGQSLNCDGINDYMQVADSPGLRITNSLTVEFWARRKQISWDIVLEKGGSWAEPGGSEVNYEVGFEASSEHL
ncbi:MAG: LamG domain-containing protein, partial [Verrucomicrobia bacterium]|nr:LamG domain-containing protein [Verrucomicrobiota bacterium]